MLFQQAALVVADVAKTAKSSVLLLAAARTYYAVSKLRVGSWDRLSAVDGAFLRFRSNTA